MVAERNGNIHLIGNYVSFKCMLKYGLGSLHVKIATSFEIFTMNAQFWHYIRILYPRVPNILSSGAKQEAIEWNNLGESVEFIIFLTKHMINFTQVLQKKNSHHNFYLELFNYII